MNQYTYKFISSSQENLIKQYINVLPSYSDCQWEISGKSESEYKPRTYPTTDWDEAVKNHSHIKSAHYNLECIEKNETHYSRYFESVTVSPVYECPKNTRAGHAESEIYCLSNAHLCDADIVGRDMDSKILFWAGHVGLTSSDNTIIEVLKPTEQAPDVVQINSFISFFNHPATRFWGDVYDYKNKKLAYLDAYRVLSAATYQMTFDPAYTISPIYRAGGFKRKYFFDYFSQQKSVQKVMEQALFRCDTFIQY